MVFTAFFYHSTLSQVNIDNLIKNLQNLLPRQAKTNTLPKSPNIFFMDHSTLVCAWEHYTVK